MDLNWLMVVKSIAGTLTEDQWRRLKADEDYRLAYRLYTQAGQDKAKMHLQKALIGLGMVTQ
jgi:hypothetical protein